MLVEQVAFSGSGTPQVYYYHEDQLGSVRALTDGTGGVANTYTYDAYGNITSSTEPVANPFKYTGQYTDQETGFLYLRARYYDPGTQQFLTVDPLTRDTEYTYATESAYKTARCVLLPT